MRASSTSREAASEAPQLRYFFANSLLAWSPRPRRPLWPHRTARGHWCCSAAGEEGDTKGNLFSLSVATGAKLWTSPGTSAGFYATPAVSRGRVFDVDLNGALTSYALPWIPGISNPDPTSGCITHPGRVIKPDLRTRLNATAQANHGPGLV